MNILINYLGKSNSGPQIAFEMAKGFANAGHRVTALLSLKIENKADWDECDTIKKVYITTYTTKKEFIKNSIKLVISGRKKLYHLLGDKKSFDVIVNPMHHLWSTFICKAFDSRIITVCHDPIQHEGENKFETYQTQKLMSMSDDIIVLSKKFIPIIENKYGLNKKHIFYMPHGLLTEYRKKRVKPHKKVYIEGKWNFLFFGRVEKYKGTEVLVQAFKILEEKRDDVELYIVGKGDLETDVSSDKHIHLRQGYIPDELVADYFDNSRTIVVLPYISATQSGVVAIALDFCNPVIASDVGGLKEQLNDGKVGLFVKPSDIKSLEKMMEYVLDHPKVLEEQKKLMAKQKDKLNWDDIMLKLSDELFNRA